MPRTVASEIMRARANAGRTLRVDPARAAGCALLLEQAALLEPAAAELRRMEVLLACAPDAASARRETNRARATADQARRTLDRLGTLSDPHGGPAARIPVSR